ncbi:hypothetical protein E4631_03030 [Hymenobacter sp. UV11]|uniref:hypothetical protein n=1 Tax=Hymenobacter sp. UV11 TaxID=1849735 RepID=UPI00105CF0E8|nr:hypothetical protein [Hymenobacter sp. UV11]TDN38416.1 hypothetical protein A8B98_23980 [Hymenobacter sp. UV11]TFZ67981.1 hypothetical protein E4631_03030 [Hymenobacter sp. UV11]
MKTGLLLLVALLGGGRAGAPPAVRVTFSPLTKAAYLAAAKSCVETKPRVTFPLKKQHGRIVIPTAKGQKVFRDSNLEEDNPDWEKYEYEGYLPQAGVHLIFHRHYEWSRMIVLSQSGQQLVFQDKPEFSLDLTSYVAISAGLEYWANSNYIRLFHLKNGTWREVWSLEPKTWEPSQVCWTSNNSLLLIKKMWGGKSPGNTFKYARLTLQ